MLSKDSIKIDLRYPEFANILVFDDNGRRFETCCFTHPNYEFNIFSISVTSDGCPVKCKFCDVPNAGIGINLSADNMESQVLLAREVINQCSWVDKNKPIKIAFNRAGEPLLNPNVYEALEIFSNKNFNELLENKLSSLEVVSMMPDTHGSNKLLDQMIDLSKTIDNEFYIQVSMHTSDEDLRKQVIPFKQIMPFEKINSYGEKFYYENNGKRKMTLTFHLMENLPVIPKDIKEIFKPDYFRVRIAYYSPTSPSKKISFPRSKLQRINELVEEFKVEGYGSYSSLISPGEHVVNTHPGAGLSLLTHLENQR